MKTRFIFGVFLMFYILSPEIGITNDNFQLLKISAQDQRAVIKTADGKMKIIKVGEVITNYQQSAVSGQASGLKVIEIAKDRIVFEEKKGNGTEKVIIRLVDGKQKVERFKKTGEQAPLMLAPVK